MNAIVQSRTNGMIGRMRGTHRALRSVRERQTCHASNLVDWGKLAAGSPLADVFILRLSARAER